MPSTTGTTNQPLVEALQALWAGDLSHRMPENGEHLEVAKEHNRFLDRMQVFYSENNRISWEVGTEGRFGGQAEVDDVRGVWKELTENLNTMAANLTNQIRDLAQTTTAIANGNLAKKSTVGCQGEIMEWQRTINVMVDQLNSFAAEVTRVVREVGTEGMFGPQAEVRGVAGTWKDLVENVNTMSVHLTEQIRNISAVTWAVAHGDLSKKITVDAGHEMRELKDMINAMINQLNRFGTEITRVARELGTEGVLGGQADIPGVEGTWKDLVDSINRMAANVTGQMREMSRHVSTLKGGSVPEPLDFAARGEVLELRDNLNALAKR